MIYQMAILFSSWIGNPRGPVPSCRVPAVPPLCFWLFQKIQGFLELQTETVLLSAQREGSNPGAGGHALEMLLRMCLNGHTLYENDHSPVHSLKLLIYTLLVLKGGESKFGRNHPGKSSVERFTAVFFNCF